MAGPDAYKEFDNTSITTTTTNKDSVYIGRYSFRKRELLLGIIAIFALLLVIILAIVLAVKGNESDSCSKDEESACSSHVTGQGTVYCDTLECMKAAVYQKPIMNMNINPCDNFYSYACGRYREHHPQTQFVLDVTPRNKILDENTENLIYLLASTKDTDHIHSYERKIKDFMTSCNNHFDKMDLRGLPLLRQIIEPLGGWYVLGTYNESTFDFSDLFTKVHIDFWADPFLTLTTRTDATNWNKKIVEFTVSGTTMQYWMYTKYPFLEPFQRNYRSYISVIAQMLAYDAGQTPNPARIANFVSDVYEVEYQISNILMETARPLFNGHEPEHRVSLRDLQGHLNNTIDLVAYMKTLFNEWPGHFEADTKVAITVENYFDNLGVVISTYLKTSEGKRKLHNYLMWHAIDRYVTDLSWNYVHAKRKLYQTLYGIKDDSSGYVYCFSIAESAFASGMSALYIKQHIKDEGKREASVILSDIRSILVDHLKKLPWMTPKDRDEATMKIQDSLYKIGFPEELVDEEYMDSYYYHVSVSETDFFGNVLAMNKMYQKGMNDDVGKKDFKTAWPYHVFDPQIEYYNPWSELIITAAMLQNPLFNPKGPTYYNYGGIGSRLASNLIHAVDEIGSNFELDGSNFGMWWSNTTRDHYQAIKECAIRKQKKENFGKFYDFRGEEVNLNTTFYASRWAPELLSDISGVRIALQAFNQHQTGVYERVPPGFENYTTTQMFFISYAQSFCQNTPSYVKTAQTDDGNLPYMNKVNMAMKNIPEFLDAFKCPRMDDSEHCLLF